MNLSDIKKLKPCQDRLDNYIKHYGNRDFTPNQFMGLKHITHDDKVWVAFRLLSESNARLAASDTAESVLHIFEKQYPNDSRPRKAIEAARAYVAGKITEEELYAYAHAANSAASSALSYASASSSYTVFAYAAASAASSADYAAYAYKEAQEKLNRKILLKYWKKG